MLEGIMKKVMMSYKVKREGIKATEGKLAQGYWRRLRVARDEAVHCT